MRAKPPKFRYTYNCFSYKNSKFQHPLTSMYRTMSSRWPAISKSRAETYRNKASFRSTNILDVRLGGKWTPAWSSTLHHSQPTVKKIRVRVYSVCPWTCAIGCTSNRRFQNHAYYRTFPGFAILSMPHNCSVVLCKKGYRTVTIVGKQANVSYHNFSSEATAQKESSESMLLEEMSVRMPGK